MARRRKHLPWGRGWQLHFNGKHIVASTSPKETGIGPQHRGLQGADAGIETGLRDAVGFKLADYAMDCVFWYRCVKTAGVPMTAKDTVRALLDRLPDDCSLDDVQYHLYVVQAIARGQADEDAGRVVSHEQVDAELRRKWLLGRAG